MPTPLMLVTNAGLAAASVATPTGPFINLVEFRVGDGFGYTPTVNDTGLNGNLLFTAAPTSFNNIGDNTIDVVCQIPPDAGPFNYGEVALYLLDGSGNKVMFAKAVFAEAQTKFSSLGTNVASSETFHCLIKLQQSIAIFQFSTILEQDVVVYNVWSDVVVPDLSANPSIPVALVQELDGAMASSLLHQSNGTKWTIGTTYEWYGNVTITNATTTTITFVPDGVTWTAGRLTTINRKYVVEFATGSTPFRSVLSLTQSGSNYVLTLNAAPLQDLPAVGSVVRVYNSINYPNTIGLATKTVTGITSAGIGLYAYTPGVFSAYGHLHSANGTGDFIINGSNNFFDTTRVSGIYIVAGSMPINAPPGVGNGGHLYVTNYEGIVSLEYRPAGGQTSTADPNSWIWITNFTSSWAPWKAIGIPAPAIPAAPQIRGGIGLYTTLPAVGEGGPGTSVSAFTDHAVLVTTTQGTNGADCGFIMGTINGTSITGGDAKGGSTGMCFCCPANNTWGVVVDWADDNTQVWIVDLTIAY